MIKKNMCLMLLHLAICMANNFFLAEARTDSTYRIKTIVIDPGHGGYDPGAKGAFTLEKNVALAVALELGSAIKAKYKDVKVIYTRTKDEFVPLYKRTVIANKNKADLFISIHCNACKAKNACGVETYIMNVRSLGRMSDIAKRENELILLEEKFEKTYEGFNPKSVESYIILSLYHNSNHNNSLSLAQKVQKHLSNYHLHDRGVRQDGFLVFWKLNPTGILIEIGFITNPKEEKYMNSEEGRKNIAQGILSAIGEYKLSVEKSSKRQ